MTQTNQPPANPARFRSRDAPARNRAAFEYLWVMEHFALLLGCLFMGVAGAVDTIAEVHGLPEHATRQNRLFQQLQILIEAMSALDPDDEHSFVTRAVGGETSDVS